MAGYLPAYSAGTKNGTGYGDDCSIAPHDGDDVHEVAAICFVLLHVVMHACVNVTCSQCLQMICS